MMGEQSGRQDRLFYEFCLDDWVPGDHLLRRIDAVLDLSWLRAELAPYYSHTGCSARMVPTMGIHAIDRASPKVTIIFVVMVSAAAYVNSFGSRHVLTMVTT